MALTAYLSDLRDLLHDTGSNFYTDAKLTTYINAARNQIAQDGYCLRAVTTSSSGVTGYSIVSGGSGYSASPTLTISAPSGLSFAPVQATATATVVAGVITAVTITNPGGGYLAAPTVTITDPTGSGADITLTISSVWTANVNQETYTFANASAVITANNPGYSSVFAVQDITVSWGSFKPQLSKLPWSAFQAYFRAINTGMSNTPSYWSQLGRGTNSTVYLYPIPSQQAEMQWDCYCLPIALVDDTTVEALPLPWTEAVKWYAAYRAYMAAQRQPDAQAMLGEYSRKMQSYSAVSSPAVVPQIYGDF